MLPVIDVQGTYYEVGFKLGKLKQDETQKLALKNPYITERLKKHFIDGQHRHYYDQYMQTLHAHYPEYLEELSGFADGAKVDKEYIFLLNLQPELSTILGDSAEVENTESIQEACQSEKTQQTPGCTNLYLKSNDCDMLLHSEDYPAMYQGACAWVEVKIDDNIKNTKKQEEFQCFYVPGYLPGSTFSTGAVVVTGNNIYQKSVNQSGIPRRFLCRKLITAENLDAAKDIVKQMPGILVGFHVHMVTSIGANLQCHSMELGSTADGPVWNFQLCPEQHFHTNIFERLEVPQYLEASSLSREKRYKEYCKEGLFTPERAFEFMTDTKYTDFPVLRDGNFPDYLQTLAIVCFDLKQRTMKIYTDKPGLCEPDLTRNIFD